MPACIRGGPLADATEEAIRYQFLDVNVFGTIFCVQAFADGLAASRGCIVNLSSALARRPLLASSVYAATKGRGRILHPREWRSNWAPGGFASMRSRPA